MAFLLPILFTSVISFGAKGDCVHDDTAAIQAAYDAEAPTGGVVFYPRGCYLVSRAGTAYFALHANGVDTIGDSDDTTTIALKAGTAASVRILNVSGDDVTIEDVAFDGHREGQTVNEQRHCVFATQTVRLMLRRVLTQGCSGDGVYLYQGTVASTLDHVTSRDNGRNGLTFGATVTDVVVTGSRFEANVAQQVDSEPGGDNVVSGIVITDSVLDAAQSNDFALTVSGTASITPGHDWTVTRNVINGGIFVVHARDVLIGWNRGVNRTTKMWEVNRSSSHVRIVGNDVQATQTTAADLGTLMVVGTAGSGPNDVALLGNRLRVTDPRGHGVRVMGAVNVVVAGNDVEGPGFPAVTSAGVSVRATVLERDFEGAIVTDNHVRGFGRGLAVTGNGAAKLLHLAALRNDIARCRVGISLDDGTGALKSATVADNMIGSDVVTPMIAPSPLPATFSLTP